ncbi:hypothetical protein M0R72_19205 [Candidatus Pacearchaeota archaeon]|jgi:hypothetical protein|nr:hypothetical protein [Candidatus Pacearchaeota archaeon]
MIEPPKIDIEKLRTLEKAASEVGQYIFETMGTEIRPRRSDEYGSYLADFAFSEDAALYVEMRNSLPAILDELEAVRAIVKELAESNPEDADERCVFCNRWQGGHLVGDPLPGHEADCLITRAKRLVNG